MGKRSRLALLPRSETTARDIVGFGPVMAAIAASAFVPAFAAASVAARLIPMPRGLAITVAGAAGLFSAFWLMGFFTPMPTLVAAERSVWPRRHLGRWARRRPRLLVDRPEGGRPGIGCGVFLRQISAG